MPANWDGIDRRAGEPEPDSWHLEKGINISLILVVVAQVVLGIWYASDFNSWRRDTDKTLARHEVAIADGAIKGQAISQEVTDRLARIETKLDVIAGKR